MNYDATHRLCASGVSNWKQLMALTRLTGLLVRSRGVKSQDNLTRRDTIMPGSHDSISRALTDLSAGTRPVLSRLDRGTASRFPTGF